MSDGFTVGGVAQSMYLIPRERIGDLITALIANGLLDPNAAAKDEELLFVLWPSKDGFYPAPSFWAVEEGNPFRRIDFLWLRGQETNVEKAELLVRDHSARCKARHP